METIKVNSIKTKCVDAQGNELVSVVRCKDCKHKPTGTGVDHDIEFPDDVCPCQCIDYWYSWMPKDNFFCAWGERREEGTVTYYADNKPIETIVMGEWKSDDKTN